ncbi:unnamed protein product [Sphagnum tenellum]
MPKPFAISVSIQAIDGVTKTLNKITGNVSKQNSALKTLNTNIGNATEIRTFGSAFRDLGSEVSGVMNSLEKKVFFGQLKKGASQAAESFKTLGSAVRQSLSMITSTGLAIGGISWLSSKTFGNISASTNELKRSAAGMNITPLKLRAYRLSAESLGLPSQSIDGALKQLNTITTNFRTRQNPAAASPIIHTLGIRLQDQENNWKKPEQLLKEIADALHDPKRPISDMMRIEVLQSILGSTDLLPMTALGSKGIEKSVQQQSNLSQEDFDRSSLEADKYLKATTGFKTALDKLGKIAAIEILPGLSRGLDRISDWIEHHGEHLKKLFSDLGKAIPGEMATTLKVLDGLSTLVSFLSEHIGLANIIFGSFAITLGSKLFSAVTLLAGAFQTLGTSMLVTSGISALRAALSAAPFLAMLGVYGLVIAAITGIGYAIVKNWDSIVKFLKSAAEFMFTVLKTIRGYLIDLNDWFTSGLSKMGKFLSMAFSLPEAIRLPTFNAEKESKIYGPTSGQGDYLQNILNAKPINKTEKQTASITVKFENMPKGAKAEQTDGNAQVAILAGRIVTHEFPYAEFPATEDLGKKTKVWNILGFLFGPLYKDDKAALEEALDSDGVGTLDHPYLGVKKQVRCLDYRVGEFNRELGFIQFAMRFCEAGSPPEPPQLLGESQRDLNKSFLEKTFEILKGATRGLANASESINDFTERLEDQAAPFVGLRDSLDQITAAVAALKDATQGIISEPSNLYHAFINILDIIVKSPASALTVIQALDFSLDPFFNLFGWGSPVVVAPFPSQLQSETVTANQVLAATALLSMSNAVLKTEPQSTYDKEKTKRIFFDRCEQFLETTENLELFALIQELRAITFRNIQISEEASQVSTLTLPLATNSLLLAYQLYGDALEEEKLHLLNYFEDPAVIPAGSHIEVIL